MWIRRAVWLLGLAIVTTTCAHVATNTSQQDDCSKEQPTCDYLDPLQQHAVEFKLMLQNMIDVNNSYEGTNRTEQEVLVLQHYLQHLDMDPLLLTLRPPTYNWYYELYQRTLTLAPPNTIFSIWHGRPSDDEVRVVAAMDDVAVERATLHQRRQETLSYQDALRLELFSRFRYRGGTIRKSEYFRTFIWTPVQYWVGFAIPNPTVLERIATHGPLVEVGAGTGYWSALLQQMGVDVLVYDAEPPSNTRNLYFHSTFTQVSHATCTSVFQDVKTTTPRVAMDDRALLMVWPNNPDKVDNPDFASSQLPPVWDVDCLQAYMAAGGATVIYVGEREENIRLIPGAPPESGLSASREFQRILQKEFELVEQIDIPHFWSYDDATIWKRQRV